MGLVDFLTEGSEDRKVFVTTNEDGESVKYYAKAMTPKDLQWVQRRHKGFPDHDQGPGMVDLIIRKVEDGAGKKILSIEDKPRLMSAGNLDRVSEMFGALFGGDNADSELSAGEQAEKN